MKQILIIVNGPALANAPPDGYHTLDRRLKQAARHGAETACCGTCLDARVLTEDRLAPEARRSTMDELAAWTVAADQVLTC